MRPSILFRFSQVTIIMLIVTACAKMSSPSGGRRDRTPPVMIESIPAQGTTNFRGKKLVFTFNEYVTLDNINDKLVVSPPMKKRPRVVLKGKSVVTEILEPLRDSTTYSFYFQDAIKDLNEGNKIENFQFVLSTGPVIDSLSVTGNVYNALDLDVPEKTMVLMYKDLADSAVERHIPDYISRVDPTGYFRINNVHQGTYRLYALKDADNSLNYNLRDEGFAFMNDPIEVTPEKNYIPFVSDTITEVKKEEKKVAQPSAGNKTKPEKESDKVQEPVFLKGEYQLILFTALNTNHYLTSSSRSLAYNLMYTLSLPPDSMNFDFSIPDVPESAYILERSRNNDTLQVWLTDSTLISQPQITTLVKYPLTDSTGIEKDITDTINMRFIAPRAPRVAKKEIRSFKMETNIGSGSLKPGNKILLSYTTPLLGLDTTRIRIYDVSDSIKKSVSYKLYKDTLNANRYIIDANLIFGKKYLYIADSAAFYNLLRQHSDSTGIRFSIKDPQDYSSLTLIISDYEGPRIIQLLNKTEKLLSEKLTSTNGKIMFPLLDIGSYLARVIYDLNNDGKWTTGDFKLHRQPEPASYYPDEIVLKLGWNAEQDWPMGVMNLKDPKLRKKPIVNK